jgi:hypothetical protein
VARLVDQAGIGVLALNFKVGRVPHEDVLRGMELFARAMFPDAVDRDAHHAVLAGAGR